MVRIDGPARARYKRAPEARIGRRAAVGGGPWIRWVWGGMARISRQTETLRTVASWSLILLAAGAGCAADRRLDAVAGLSVARTLAPGADLAGQAAGLIAIKGRVVALRSTPRWVEFELVEPDPAEPRGAATPVRVAIPLIGPEATVLGERWSGRVVRVLGTVDGLASPPALLVDGPPRVFVLDDSETAVATGTGAAAAPAQEGPAGAPRRVEPLAIVGPETGAANAGTSPPRAAPPSAVPGAAPAPVAPGGQLRVVEHAAGPPPAAPTGMTAGGPEPAAELSGRPRPTPTASAGPSAECQAAREARATAAALARAASDRLASCLATRVSCRAEIAAARDPLAAVAAAEERVAWLCLEAP